MTKYFLLILPIVAVVIIAVQSIFPFSFVDAKNSKTRHKWLTFVGKNYSVTWSPYPTATPTSTPKPSTSPTPKATSTPTPKPSMTATPKPSASPTITKTSTTSTSTTGTWAIQSISSMKETKDRICSQRPADFITKWLSKAKELGANYVAIETPYDNPDCGDSLAYTKLWVSLARKQGLKVWHRHMPLKFEGIYGKTKDTSTDYIPMITSYIKNNPSLFAAGDIFTPIPEPQNGGISGITYCSQGICEFSSAATFNSWLRNAISQSNTAFTNIGLGGKLKVGYYGFDGFVAWGANNPDWHGILEDATVKLMGNITIDHYPQLIGSTMTQGLNELQSRYPGVPIVIGEWGSVGDTSTEQQVKDTMSAAARTGVVGFNYWHMGMGGNEALINDDFTNRAQFDEVQSYFKKR